MKQYNVCNTREPKVVAKKILLHSHIEKALFLVAMLAIAIFATDSEASVQSDNIHPAGFESSVIASGVYVASHYAYNHYRRPYKYRNHYRPRSRYYYPRYYGNRYHNRSYYNKRYYNRHGYGNGYRYRGHY